MTAEFDRVTTVLFPPGFEEYETNPGGTTAAEHAILEASRYADQGADALAIKAYLQADELLGNDRSPRHAEVLICLSMLYRKQGDMAQSSRYLDLALAIFPEHRAALTQRLDNARSVGDFALAAALRNRSLRFCESVEARAHVLTEVVDDALCASVSALEQAIELRPGDLELRERLRALLEAKSDYEGAINASVVLAECVTEPKSRARVLTQAATLCAKKVHNIERAVALYEAAIADDPTVPGAFEAIESVLTSVGDAAGTEQAYVRQIERLEEGGYEREEAVLLRKLATLREEQLLDMEGAISAFERVTLLCPEEVEPRLLLARAHERTGEVMQAVKQLEVTVRLAPTDPLPYRELFRIAKATEDHDRAFYAASVLVYLGEANTAEQAAYRRRMSCELPTAEVPFDDAMLAELRPASHPVRALLLTIHDAAIAAKLQIMRPSKMPSGLSQLKQTPANALPVTVVDCLCKLLGLPAFTQHLRSNEPFTLLHPMVATPSIVHGASMLTGQGVSEVLFRIGYELGAQRELGRIPVFFGSPDELQTLVQVAVALCNKTEIPLGAADLARALDSQLTRAMRGRLKDMVKVVTERAISLDVSRLLYDVELISARIGLIACSDVTVAARQIAMESRPTPRLTTSERIRDLLAFAVSDVHMQIRRQLKMPPSWRKASSSP